MKDEERGRLVVAEIIKPLSSSFILTSLFFPPCFLPLILFLTNSFRYSQSLSFFTCISIFLTFSFSLCIFLIFLYFYSIFLIFSSFYSHLLTFSFSLFQFLSLSYYLYFYFHLSRIIYFTLFVFFTFSLILSDSAASFPNFCLPPSLILCFSVSLFLCFSESLYVFF